MLIGQERLERRLVARRRQRDVVQVQVEVEVRIVLPVRARSAGRDPRRPAGESAGSDRRGGRWTTSRTRSQSTGSSNHIADVITIRFVG